MLAMESLDYEDDKKKPNDDVSKWILNIFKKRSKASYLSWLCDGCWERILNCICK